MFLCRVLEAVGTLAAFQFTLKETALSEDCSGVTAKGLVWPSSSVTTVLAVPSSCLGFNHR